MLPDMLPDSADGSAEVARALYQDRKNPYSLKAIWGIILGEDWLIHRRAYVSGWICLKTKEIRYKTKEIRIHSPPLGARARARPRGGSGYVFLWFCIVFPRFSSKSSHLRMPSYG